MADDLLEVLTRFHQKVVLPDIERIVGTAIEGSERRLRDEMHTLFDGMAQRLDRLETEYHMLVAGMKRIEERMDRLEGRMDHLDGRLERVEKKLDKLALKADLDVLRSRVDELQARIRVIEAELAD